MRIRIATLLLAATCLAAPAAAQPQPAPATAAELPRYSARQFFETTSHAMASPDGIAFSRDGRNLLVTTDRSGVFNAYALPVAGGDPVQLTTSTDNAILGQSYFPNDDRVLYVADQGGNELHHVYVRLPDGTVRDLTPGERHKASFLGWSADGSRFFVSTNERNPQMFDVYAYDSTSYERELIFQNEGFLIGDISRDGRNVALIRAISSANSDVYLAQVGSSEAPRLITEHQGNVAYDVYGFTPDGSALIYGTNETSEFGQAWRYDLAGGARAPMIAADWT
ncbi:MAG: TolB family protein [Sphingosinicella sp.]|uniref:TolB family protein n=1 Tax=Sphingosinicella sp. TaxID=1917971 RepID=UPI004037FF72